MITLFQRSRWENREDGRFFAALRMTCFAIAIVETYRTSVGTYFHSEEADLKVGQTFLSARIASNRLPECGHFDKLNDHALIDFRLRSE